MSLLVRRDGDICELRLASPPGNVLDRAICGALAEAIRQESRDPALKAFLLRADGRHFSYGASVPQHEAGEVEGFLPAFHDAVLALVDCGVPSIAAVQGLCLGGAFELVAACSFLLADATATFGVPEIQLGVFPPVACVLLPWHVSGAVAEELILTGRRIGAEEAQELGLIRRVTPQDGLDSAVAAFVDEHLRPRSASSLRIAARAVRAPLLLELKARLPALERAYLDELMATHDAREGIRAFIEKRMPAWSDS